MEKGFELLEEKVRKASDLMVRLRRDNAGLLDEAKRLRGRIQDLELAAHAAEKSRGSSPEETRRTAGLEQEVKTMRQEREQIRQRIARIVAALDVIE
jgi:predicted  nucleic acid-binding Zn-ribbon protein